eukprot:c2578_g1_i1.p1 GENE.c2578_g1_i1~~c2578_g1_i1.p1  ORF type:complete len:412 (-),score=65.73 c2578_g1_i1:161-1279(-)
MKAAALKYDHFENIHRLVDAKIVIEGAPNFRKVPGYPVFGTGQPTFEALSQVLEMVRDTHGHRRVLWLILRQEPVIYMNGMSFTPRDRDHLNENMEFPNTSGAEMAALQDDFVQAVRSRMPANNNNVTYFRDTYAEHPADRKNIEYTVATSGPSSVLTPAGLTKLLCEKGFDLHFERFPIVDERAPSFSDLDGMVKVISGEPPGCACLFNCQMGKGRTTCGMIVACLVHQALGTPRTDDPRPTLTTSSNPLLDGLFQCVNHLLTLHPDMPAAKQRLDEAIDLCGPPVGLQNLRECIMWTKEKFDAEPEEKKPFWSRMSRNFIQRYITLICFSLYVGTEVKSRFSTTFADWMNEHPKIQIECDMTKFDSFAWC